MSDAEKMLVCDHCSYNQNGGINEPWFQQYVQPLIYFTTVLLPVTYAVGLYFSLKSHSDRIYHQAALVRVHSTNRAPILFGPYLRSYCRLVSAIFPLAQSTTKSQIDATSVLELPMEAGDIALADLGHVSSSKALEARSFDHGGYRGTTPQALDDLGAGAAAAVGTPVGGASASASAERISLDGGAGVGGTTLAVPVPNGSVPFDEERASVASSSRRMHRTASSSSHQSHHSHGSGQAHAHGGGGGGDHGHKPPPWSRRKALFILIMSTILFALLAGTVLSAWTIEGQEPSAHWLVHKGLYAKWYCATEILVNSVDEVLHGSPISEKFLGVTLFAIVCINRRMFSNRWERLMDRARALGDVPFDSILRYPA